MVFFWSWAHTHSQWDSTTFHAESKNRKLQHEGPLFMLEETLTKWRMTGERECVGGGFWVEQRPEAQKRAGQLSHRRILQSYTFVWISVGGSRVWQNRQRVWRDEFIWGLRNRSTQELRALGVSTPRRRGGQSENVFIWQSEHGLTGQLL